jgi:Cof subfamily protein (haloacid dehalogenase superfamily)
VKEKLSGKLLALDVDGTLLDASGDLRERTQEALVAARNAGATLTLATGRDWETVKQLLAVLPSVQYSVCTNGLEIFTNLGERLVAQEIDLELARNVVLKIRQRLPGVAIGAGIDGHLVGEPDISKALPILPAGISSFPAKSVDDIMPALTMNTQDIVIYHGDYHFVLEGLFNIVNEVVQEEGLDVVYSGLPMIEILPAGCGKDTGLSWLSSHLEIDQADVIAFGDGVNDLSMLRWAGVGVAMGQASLNVLGCADEVTLTNEEDGVAVWIETQLEELH